METNINTNYNDKWREFVTSALRNVAFLNKNIPDNIIREISYQLESINLSKNEHLFEAGKPCKEIYIVCNGLVEISVKNAFNSLSTYLDTLYSGCTIGGYSVLIEEEYSLNGKALEDCIILKLKYKKLSELRDVYEELDTEMSEYEQYTAENGLPNCDYKLNRNNVEVKPIEILKHAVNLTMRLIKSHKSTGIADLLINIQEQLKKERKEKTKAYRKKNVIAVPQSKEEKLEKILYDINDHIVGLHAVLNNQVDAIQRLESKIKHCKGCNNEISDHNSFDGGAISNKKDISRRQSEGRPDNFPAHSNT